MTLLQDVSVHLVQRGPRREVNLDRLGGVDGVVVLARADQLLDLRARGVHLLLRLRIKYDGASRSHEPPSQLSICSKILEDDLSLHGV